MKKVILITGASSGIGEETAKKLCKEGHIVYAAARRLEKMKPLEELGAKLIGMDVTEDQEMKSAVERIIDEQGRIDVLVNNAGFAVFGSVEDITIDEARNQFEVNIFGLARLTQLVLPQMRKQKSGTIINMSSMGGKMYTPLGAWYHATKYALEGWSDCLRLELKQFNINVVLIEPGGIKTEFADVMLDPMVKRSKDSPYEELAKKLRKGTKETYESGRASHPSVIADCISHAVNAKKPKTRYLKGFMAKPAVFIRKYFGSKVWDFLIMRAA